jgi:hypothetical protein
MVLCEEEEVVQLGTDEIVESGLTIISLRGL